MTEAPDLVSTRWLMEQLRRYTYRPSWELSIMPGDGRFVPDGLRVRYSAIDARDPTRTIPIVATFTIHLGVADPDWFARWLADTLMDVERHESREWLRRDGLIYDDPHDETANQPH